ncbi:MAG: hypothetical protein V4719_00835 [Planctomycetota bacterium]
MSAQIEGSTRAFRAGGAIGAYKRVILSSGKLALAGVGATDYGNEIGITEQAAFADGDVISVRLRNAPGTRKATAATSFAVGAVIYGAAAGNIDDVSSGTQLGIALEAATALNDVVEFLPI